MTSWYSFPLCVHAHINTDKTTQVEKPWEDTRVQYLTRFTTPNLEILYLHRNIALRVKCYPGVQSLRRPLFLECGDWLPLKMYANTCLTH